MSGYVAIGVKDLGASRRFFCDALGLAAAGEWPSQLAVGAGGFEILLDATGSSRSSREAREKMRMEEDQVHRARALTARGAGDTMKTMSDGSGKIRARKMTMKQYLALPEDNGHYHALLDGELEVTPAATPQHQIIVGRLFRLLDAYVSERKLGEVLLSPVDVIFDERNATQPDIAFIRAGRLGIIGPKNIRGAPDLAVEVLSPTTRRLDLGKKKEIYARFAVPSYWIVDPKAERVDFLRHEAGAYALEARVERPEIGRPRAFSGLALPLGEIFK